MPEQEQPQPPPNHSRARRELSCTEGQGEEDQENWSDTPSKGDEHQDETSKHRVDPHLGRPRHWQSRPSNPRDLSDTQDNTTGDGPGYQKSCAGGQTIPYGFSRPFTPRPPQNTRTSNPHPSNPHSSNPHPSNPHPSNPHPSNPHPSNPHPSNPHPSNPHPSNPYPTGPYATNPYPANPYPANSYPANLYPANLYPVDPYPANLYPPNPQFMPSYGPIPNFWPQPPMNSPYHIEHEVEKVKRDLNTVKMKQQMARRQQEERQRVERKQVEAAERRETSRRDYEKLQRHMERQVKAELDKKLQLKRDVRDRETRYDSRELVEYQAAGRQIEDSWRMREDRTGGETDQLLLEFAEFVEDKLRRQDGRRSHEGSVKGSLNGPGRSRLEVAPRELFQNRPDEVFRGQGEDVVIDLLQRLKVEREMQETDFASDRPMCPSVGHGQGDRLSLPPAPHYVLEGYPVSEGQRRTQDWQPDKYGGSLGLQSSSSHTAVNSSDQYSPSESSQFAGRPQRSPTSGHGHDRKQNSRKSHPLESRAPRDGKWARTSAPGLDDSPEQVSRNAGDDGYPFPANAQRDESWNRPNGGRFGERRGQPGAAPNTEHGRKRGKSDSQAKRRGRRDPMSHAADHGGYSSDESDNQDLFPSRPSPYTFTPNRRDLDDIIPPPVAPDPPPASA
jgi:hypothetical protein